MSDVVVPRCPIHDTDMRATAGGASFYCPRRVPMTKDTPKGYCRVRMTAAEAMESIAQRLAADEPSVQIGAEPGTITEAEAVLMAGALRFAAAFADQGILRTTALAEQVYLKMRSLVP